VYLVLVCTDTNTSVARAVSWAARVRAPAVKEPGEAFLQMVHEEGVENVLDPLHLRIAPRCRLSKKWSEGAATFVLVSASPRDFRTRACSPYRIRLDWYVLFLKWTLYGRCCLPPTPWWSAACLTSVETPWLIPGLRVPLSCHILLVCSVCRHVDDINLSHRQISVRRFLFAFSSMSLS
jgi:hypothetical protein